MLSFLEFFRRGDLAQRDPTLLLEYEQYRLISGTRNSYRQDSADTATLTQLHSHVYAKPKGRGAQLYAVNFDGSGHDGSSGVRIPDAHAEFFRQKGYAIPDTNVLESISADAITSANFQLVVLNDASEVQRFGQILNG